LKPLVDSPRIAHNSDAYPTRPALNGSGNFAPTFGKPRRKLGVLMTQQENRAAAVELEQKLRSLADYEKKMDEIAELVARVRHEINNPLTGVLGQAQLLLREELSVKARKRVQTIEDLSIRMRDIVAQLRQVQRSVRGGEEENETAAEDQSAEAAVDV
jgi:signal transduction histidine kinase